MAVLGTRYREYFCDEPGRNDGSNILHEVVGGSLPPGLEFRFDHIEGSPTQTGTFEFQIRTSNPEGSSYVQTQVITVLDKQGAQIRASKCDWTMTHVKDDELTVGEAMMLARGDLALKDLTVSKPDHPGEQRFVKGDYAGEKFSDQVYLLADCFNPSPLTIDKDGDTFYNLATHATLTIKGNHTYLVAVVDTPGSTGVHITKNASRNTLELHLGRAKTGVVVEGYYNKIGLARIEGNGTTIEETGLVLTGWDCHGNLIGAAGQPGVVDNAFVLSDCQGNGIEIRDEAWDNTLWMGARLNGGYGLVFDGAGSGNQVGTLPEKRHRNRIPHTGQYSFVGNKKGGILIKDTPDVRIYRVDTSNNGEEGIRLTGKATTGGVVAYIVSPSEDDNTPSPKGNLVVDGGASDNTLKYIGIFNGGDGNGVRLEDASGNYISHVSVYDPKASGLLITGDSIGNAVTDISVRMNQGVTQGPCIRIDGAGVVSNLVTKGVIANCDGIGILLSGGAGRNMVSDFRIEYNDETAVRVSGADNNSINNVQVIYQSMKEDLLYGLEFVNGASHNTAQGLEMLDTNGPALRFSGAGTSHNAVYGSKFTYVTPHKYEHDLHSFSGVVFENKASNNTVSGSVIKGYTNHQVVFRTGAHHNRVYASQILDSGRFSPVEHLHGVLIDNTHDNTVGDCSGMSPETVIRGNTGDGVRITGRDARSNLVCGCRIGGPGEKVQDNGVVVAHGASDNRIGGTGPVAANPADPVLGSANLIQGHTAGAGVLLTGQGTDHNRVAGNLLGITDSKQAYGVRVENGASYNQIGVDLDVPHPVAVDQSTIRFIGNTKAAISIDGPETKGNVLGDVRGLFPFVISLSNGANNGLKAPRLTVDKDNLARIEAEPCSLVTIHAGPFSAYPCIPVIS